MDWHALVIDAHTGQLRTLVAALAEDGWLVRESRDAAEALAMIDEQPWALLLCAVNNQQTGGSEAQLRLVQQFKARHNTTLYIIILADEDSGEVALEGLRNGADDYVVGPFAVADIDEKMRARRTRWLAKAREHAGGIVISPHDLAAADDLIGNSMIAVKRELEMISLRDPYSNTHGSRARPSSLFISGETGTGKELVARTFHRYGNRSSRPFVAVNCAMLSPELAESQLFGHVRGSFTGAMTNHKGKFEVASGGTLFLDEIGEMSLAVQAKMLRALQEGEIEPLGSNTPVGVDVQVISATNRRIDEEIKAGRFRADLFYRLRTHVIELEPLRQRTTDIARLVKHFAPRYATKEITFSASAIGWLMQYSWPGNVRELEQVVEQAIMRTPDEVVLTLDLPKEIRDSHEREASKITCGNSPEADGAGLIESNLADEAEALPARLKKMKMEVIYRTIGENQGNVAAAARQLKTTRQNLYQTIERERRASEALKKDARPPEDQERFT